MTNTLPYRLGVGLVIINNKAEIFTGRRLDGTKAWQMPQGGIDNDFITFGPPEITIEVCPDSGVKLASESTQKDESTEKVKDFENSNPELDDSELTKEEKIQSALEEHNADMARMRDILGAERKLEEVKNRIIGYTNIEEDSSKDNKKSENFEIDDPW